VESCGQILAQTGEVWMGSTVIIFRRILA